MPELIRTSPEIVEVVASKGNRVAISQRYKRDFYLYSY